MKTALWYCGIMFLVIAYFAATVPKKEQPPPDFRSGVAMSSLAFRMNRLVSHMDSDERRYWQSVYPVESILQVRANNATTARRVAWIVDSEARALGMSPMLMAGVISIENPWLIADTTSSAGAVGIMQVMPMHYGQHASCDGELDEELGNVCYGISVFREQFRLALHRAIRSALLGFNGCVSTPGCKDYPDKVLSKITNNE